MKKVLLFFSLLGGLLLQAQHKHDHDHEHGETCGTHYHQRVLERQNPELLKKRMQLEQEIATRDAKAFRERIGARTIAGRYVGQIYEIPVVVHIIEARDNANQHLSLTDEQIQTWIDNCNKMYATTYGNGYYAEGDGPDGGAVIPFKLVLAKRTPQCAPTNGILRYDATALEGYSANGLKNGTGTDAKGATPEAMRQLAPMWPASSYFNIYIVTGFNGNKSTWGLMGYCYYPTAPDNIYSTVMKVTVVTNEHDSTLAHEFGHGLGLDHTFEGTDKSPNATELSAADCPVNNDCTKDNDKICDTEPGANLLNVWPVPTNDSINVCTGEKYQGVQYNIMNYTAAKRKFTAGQRERALDVFMSVRENLTKSLGATPIGQEGNPVNVNSACVPTLPGPIQTNYGIGPNKVVLGSINNPTTANNKGTPSYYDDFTAVSCFNPTIFTDIKANGESEITIDIAVNPQWVKVWIDYNNDGQFENATELVGMKHVQVAKKDPNNQNEDALGKVTYTFTPPADAVKNTYLRMRVMADWENKQACDLPSYGQIEDYAVRIVENLSTKDVEKNALEDDVVVYSPASDKLLLQSSGSGFGAFKIYDMAGKLVQQGTANVKEIKLNKLPKGIYIINYSNNKGQISKKFVK